MDVAWGFEIMLEIKLIANSEMGHWSYCEEIPRILFCEWVLLSFLTFSQKFKEKFSNYTFFNVS